MAESINDIAIKLSVDAAGVSKGFRTAAEEARSYKAELDRLVYAVGRSEPVDYNAHVTQYTQATNERLAKEKKAQEEFNAWYRGEADREFQAWYAVELKKEQVREQQLAEERQRAINTSNAQNSQRQLPAETAARGDENAALREAITQRFALRDVEDRAIAANVANRDAAQRRVVADAAKAQQQELADLRQAITQRYALRDQEERQEQLYAANMAGISRMSAERIQRTADQANAQRAADFAAYKADLARQESEGAAHAERVARQEQLYTDNIAGIARLRAETLAKVSAQIAAQGETDFAAYKADLARQEAAGTLYAGNLDGIARSQAERTQRAAEQAQAQRDSDFAEYKADLVRQELAGAIYAGNVAGIARMQAERTQQAADAADAQRDSDFVAYKADLARQEAAGMINAERTARIERARQRDAKRAADDDRVRQLNDWRMQQALMQRAAMDTQLTVARMGGGFGGAAMAMGQLSYAAEDFIQVLSMGGGLNMALMSASNNLSMVARALLGTSGMMSAVAGFAIPALLIGTGILIQYLLREEDQVDAVTRAYKRLHDELEHTQELLSQQMQHRFNMQDIDDLATYSAAIAKLRQEIRDLAEAEAKAAALEEKIAATRKEIRDTVAGGTIIADAQKIADMMAQSAGVHGADAIAAAKKDVRDLTEAYEDLADSMATGTPDEIVRAAEEMKRVIDGTSEVFKLELLNGEQAAKLAAILGTEDEIVKLEALRELMQELALINGDMANGADAIAKTQENINRLLRQETQLRQDNIRFQLEATDAQKEAADIQNQLSSFLGIDNSNPMQGMNPDDMSAEQARQSAEFLELMWRNLDRQKKELLDEKQRVTPVGGLEQNTYQAQADAFKQILEATNRQEDPQLTRLIRLQETANDLLEDITGIRIVQ
jgi:hypothetical protein